MKFLKITFDEHQTSTNVGEDEVIRKYAEIDYISTSHKNIYIWKAIHQVTMMIKIFAVFISERNETNRVLRRV